MFWCSYPLRREEALKYVYSILRKGQKVTTFVIQIFITLSKSLSPLYSLQVQNMAECFLILKNVS